MQIMTILFSIFLLITTSLPAYESGLSFVSETEGSYCDECQGGESSSDEDDDFQEGTYYFPFPDERPSKTTDSRDKCRSRCGVQDFHLATGCSCCVRQCEDGSECMEYNCGRPSEYHPESRRVYDLGGCGIWFPEDPPLFRPFAADPRQTTFSVGRRFNDDALPKNVIPVSYWDSFPLYRRLKTWPWGGMLQVDIDGALWAVFDPDTFSAPLINADYYGGLSITYAWCQLVCAHEAFPHLFAYWR